MMFDLPSPDYSAASLMAALRFETLMSLSQVQETPLLSLCNKKDNHFDHIRTNNKDTTMSELSGFLKVRQVTLPVERLLAA